MSLRSGFRVVFCLSVILAASNLRAQAPTKPLLGPELMSRTDFKDGSLPGNGKWSVWKGKTKINVSNLKGALRVEVGTKSDDPDYLPVLLFIDFPVEKGKRYCLRYEIRAESPSTLKVAVKQSQTPHTVLGLPETPVAADKEWKVWTHEFTATATETKPVWVGFSHLEPKHVYEWRRISCRPVLNAGAATEATTTGEPAGPETRPGEEPNELTPLRTQYEEKVAQARQVYADALAKELTVLKKKGGLDSYLELEKELKFARADIGFEFSDYKPDNRALVSLKSRCRRDVETARTAYMKKLDELSKEFLRSGRIDDAKFIQSTLERLNALSNLHDGRRS